MMMMMMMMMMNRPTDWQPVWLMNQSIVPSTSVRDIKSEKYSLYKGQQLTVSSGLVSVPLHCVMLHQLANQLLVRTLAVSLTTLLTRTH